MTRWLEANLNVLLILGVVMLLALAAIFVSELTGQGDDDLARPGALAAVTVQAPTR